MSHTHYITGHCIIGNNTVQLNGEVVCHSAAEELSAFLLAVYQHFKFNYPRFYKMDNLSKLGWLTAEILLQHRQLTEQYDNEKIGLILSNASSSLDADLRYLDTIDEAASPALFVYTLPNIVIGEISIRHKFKGESAFFISEQFNAALIHDQVHLLLDNQLLQTCICGWVEVLGQSYQSGLFLVEPAVNDDGIAFSRNNLHRLMNSANE